MATFTGSDKAISFLFDMVANIAEDYDETSTYSVNDYAIYEGVLYKCTSAILVAETFTPAHWSSVLIMDEVAAGGGGGSSTLAGLSDVALSSVANGDVLMFDSALNKWKNAIGGGSNSEYSFSQNERAVGTWLDGSTIYEKTFVYSKSDFYYWTQSSSQVQGEVRPDIQPSTISKIWINNAKSILIYNNISLSATADQQPSIAANNYVAPVSSNSAQFTRSTLNLKPAGYYTIWCVYSYPTLLVNNPENWSYIFTLNYVKNN